MRSTSRTASPEIGTHLEHHLSQQSTSTPLSSRNLRSSGHPAEHVDVEHIDISHLSREARALLEDDLAHTPGSQGSPRLRASTRSTSRTPSRGPLADASKARRGKPSSARRIEDISVTEDDDDHQQRMLYLEPAIDESPTPTARDEEDPTPEAEAEVEAWRENLNPVNAALVDTEISEAEPEAKVSTAPAAFLGLPANRQKLKLLFAVPGKCRCLAYSGVRQSVVVRLRFGF